MIKTYKDVPLVLYFCPRASLGHNMMMVVTLWNHSSILHSTSSTMRHKCGKAATHIDILHTQEDPARAPTPNPSVQRVRDCNR